MTDEEVAAEMRHIAKLGDGEISHGMADELLIKLIRHLGSEQTADAWESVDKWYA